MNKKRIQNTSILLSIIIIFLASSTNVFAADPVMNSSRISPTPTSFDYQNLTGYCNATDADNDSLFYNYKWYKNNEVYYQGVAFKNGSISAGGTHTCGIRANDSRVLCWGYNANGALGTGNTTNYHYPTLTNDSSAYSSISTGAYHTCGIRANDSRVLCWGYNYYGQLGINSTTSKSFPTQITDTAAYQTISSGVSNTCGIRANDSKALCWGNNFYGTVGDGTTTSRILPTLVNSTGAFKQISAGAYHTCGIRANDSLIYCWGRNDQGQLGTNTGGADSINPIKINDSSKYLLVTTGTSFTGEYSIQLKEYTCALRANDSRAVCWGYNAEGELGDATTTTRTNPAQVADNASFTTLSSGGGQTCGIRTNDSLVYCWGNNGFYALGDGTSTNRNIPTIIANRSEYISISAGIGGIYDDGEFFWWAAHTCGIRASDGRVLCWGYNDFGQLGKGDIISTGYPTVTTDSSSYAGRYNESTIINIPYQIQSAYTEAGQNWTLSCQAFDSVWSAWMNSTQTLITEAINTCTWSGSGDWTISGQDYCILATNTALNSNNFICGGTGQVIVAANITNWTNARSEQNCTITVNQGGSLRKY